MQIEKILLVTNSAVLKSWCDEELHDCFTVSSVSFREYEQVLSIFEYVDRILIDYSLEDERCILKLYEYLLKKNCFNDLKKIVILYDSYSHNLAKLKFLFRKADFFNLIAPAFALKKFLEDVSTGSRDFYEVKTSDSCYLKKDTSMESFCEKLKIAAANNECVLLLGESGSGKTWAAKMIHKYSGKCKEKFFNVNVAEFNPNLIEGNLFGTTAGAYTGAVAQKGWFEMANNGTLLLDEIGELPYNLQAKLLSVIEEHKYKKLGSTKEYSFDEKLIFATNKNLEDCVKNKTFRSDLYYRINCLTLYVPPLRSHKCDIPVLANKFSQEHNKQLSDNAIEKLCNYAWPGNIRELKNVIMRASFFSKKGILTADDIRFSYYE